MEDLTRGHSFGANGLPGAIGRFQRLRSVAAAVLAGILASGPAQAQAPLVLQDATPIKMRLSENLSSETARIGDTVSFEVLEDIMVGDLIVIKQGATAIATITQAQAKRRMGRGGKLDVNIDYVRTVAGDKIALRAVRENSGGSKSGAMTAGIVATSIVFFPAAPFFLFMKGKEVTIPKGTEITSYVHSDVRLDEARLRAAAVNASTPNPAAAAPAPAPIQQPAVQAPAGSPVSQPQAPLPAAAAAPAPRGGLRNSDVVELKRAGFSDDLIITKINGSTCSFSMETSDMIELKKAGLSDKVIAAMMAKLK